MTTEKMIAALTAVGLDAKIERDESPHYWLLSIIGTTAKVMFDGHGLHVSLRYYWSHFGTNLTEAVAYLVRRIDAMEG